MGCNATLAPTVGPNVKATNHPHLSGGFPVELIRIDGQTRKETDTLPLDVSCTSTPACVSRDLSCMSCTMSIRNRIPLPSSQYFGRIARHQILVPRFILFTQHSVTRHCSPLLIATNLSEAVIWKTQRACEYYRARGHASHNLFDQKVKAESPSILFIFREFIR